MAQDASDLQTLVEAEKIKRDKKRLAAASKLAKKQRDRKRISQRVNAEEKRTGARLLGKAAPKSVQRGKSGFSKPAGSKPFVQKKPAAVINVMRGSETREKVRRATE